MTAFARGDRVVVTQFVRRGDDSDIDELDGWLVQMTDRTVTIASSPDFEYLEFDTDYFTATYPLDEVIVSPFQASMADRGATTPAATLFWLGFLMVVGTLVSLFYMPAGRGHLFIILTGSVLMAAVAAVGTIAAIERRNHS